MRGSKRKNRKTLQRDELASETKTISFPIEIIQEILSWLPIKPLLQSTSVSKPWLSLITQNPSFPKLHFTHSLTKNRTAVFIPAYDKSAGDQHFLSAPTHGGPVTHLITLPNVSFTQSIYSQFQHVNGLILFTTFSVNFDNMNSIFDFVINPATRNIYKLFPPPYDAPPITDNYRLSEMHTFFGFDESINEHKVLNIRVISNNRHFGKPYRKIFEVMVFSLSDYSWTKIHVKDNEFPLDIISYGNKMSVCVNNVIHMSLNTMDRILAFDLTTYKFHIVKIPDDAIPDKLTSAYYKKRRFNNVKGNRPFLMKADGLFVLACHHRVLETNEMEIWILKDYQNGVWVKETVAFNKSWIELDNPDPLDFLSKDEILFSLKRLPRNRNRISVPVYDIKTRKFKSVKFSLGPQLLHSDTLMFNDVVSYVESVYRLKGNETGTSSS